MRLFYSDRDVVDADTARINSVLRSVRNWRDGPRAMPEEKFAATLRGLIEELEELEDEG